MKKTLLASALAVSSFAASAAPLSIQHLWTYEHTSGVTSEIPAYDALTRTLWVAGVVGVDVFNAATGSLLQHIDTTGFGAINSVAIHNGLAALAIENLADRTQPGQVVLFDTLSRGLAAGVNRIGVGALPDMLTFTPDGSRLLIANEATPTVYGGFDQAGSISIIDMASRTASTASFAGAALGGATCAPLAWILSLSTSRSTPPAPTLS